LLLRAPGIDTRESRSTAVETTRSKSQIGASSFKHAMAAMIPNLDAELERFAQDLRDNKSAAVVSHRPGYGGGGHFTWTWLLGLSVLGGLAHYLKR
jgi:rhombotail lipoprotein